MSYYFLDVSNSCIYTQGSDIPVSPIESVGWTRIDFARLAFIIAGIIHFTPRWATVLLYCDYHSSIGRLKATATSIQPTHVRAAVEKYG
jgi:hypothetical protein